MEIKLPCDEVLWKAESAKEWYHAMHTPSPYGAGPRRLACISMQQALASLDISVPPEVQAQLNPFSHFIIIHTILRNVFSSPPPTPSAHLNGYDPFNRNDSPSSPNLGSGSTTLNEYVLQNWLQMWTHNSEGMLSESRFEHEASPSSMPFVASCMPFYWLAHYAIVASQEGLLDVRPGLTDLEAQDRCRLISSWLNEINAYLDKGYQLPLKIQDFGCGMPFSASHSSRVQPDDYFSSSSSAESPSIGYL